MASKRFPVIGEWVDEVTATDSSLSLDSEAVPFVLSGSTSSFAVASPISGDNDDDAAGWVALECDCDDNVVISETGVAGVVTAKK